MAPIWTCSMCQMQATFPGVEFLRTLSRFKKGKENLSLCVDVLQKTNHIRGFHLEVIQWMSKKFTKKCDRHAELFFLIKPIVFWSCCWDHHHSCLSSLMISPLEISRSVIGMVVIFFKKVLFVNLAGLHHQSCPKIIPQLAQHLGVVKLTCCYNVLVTWRVLLHDPASKQLEPMNMQWLPWMM